MQHILGRCAYSREHTPDVFAHWVLVIVVKEKAQPQGHVMHGQRLQILQLWEDLIRTARPHS